MRAGFKPDRQAEGCPRSSWAARSGGPYGAGPMIVWDTGAWAPVGDAYAGLAKGAKFRLSGEKKRARSFSIELPRAGKKASKRMTVLPVTLMSYSRAAFTREMFQNQRVRA